MVEVKELADGVAVPLLVEPGASRDRLYGEHGGRLKLSVTAPPEKGKANKAVCKFLAARLGLSKSQVRILSGHNSRLKEVLIERVSRDALEAIIA
ncbi:MAG: YggU family protein [Candidatus Brocadiae bacterium]|nr:YggU family protein [Candidatus Brocadiia bacterium]